MYQLSHGSVDGWVWDVGSPSDAPAPPVISFEEICVADTAQGSGPELLVQPVPSSLPPNATPIDVDGAVDVTTAESNSNKNAEPLVPDKTPQEDLTFSYILFGVLLVVLVAIWARSRK